MSGRSLVVGSWSELQYAKIMYKPVFKHVDLPSRLTCYPFGNNVMTLFLYARFDIEVGPLVDSTAVRA